MAGGRGTAGRYHQHTVTVPDRAVGADRGAGAAGGRDRNRPR